MKNVIASAAKQSVVTFFLLIALVLFGCAKREPEVDFRPLQMHWNLAEEIDESVADSLMPRKDNCMILLTGRLMAEPSVQASTAGELSYEVSFKRDPEKPENLVFEGNCADLSIMDMPECRWRATCDADLKIVVKFHNGD